MDFNEYNLRQLLEFALRFPQIGAVNFKALYLILKTIIKTQGIECLTPNFTVVYESPSDAAKKKIIIGEDSKSSNETDEEEKERKMVEMKKELHKLNETVKQLTSKVSVLESRSVQEGEEYGQSSVKETSSETDDDSDSKTKVSDDIQETPLEDKETKKKPKSEKKKTISGQNRFIWHKDKLKKDIQDIKDDVESKENDQKEMQSKMDSLQASNENVEERFKALLQDFETCMNVHSKLGTQVEELDQIVRKKITIEDDLEKLKEQVDKLDAYVYSSQHKPGVLSSKEKMEKKPIDAGPLTEEKVDTQFVRGEVEKPAKVDRKTDFARMVKDFMAMPEEKRAEIRQGTIQPESKKVKPTTMKKAYETFIQAAQETPAANEEGTADLQLKGTEVAVEIDASQLQGQAEIPASEVIIHEDDTDSPIRGTAQKKLHKAVKAITLLQDMQKTQKAAKLLKAKEKEAVRELQDGEVEIDEEQISSADSIEISEPSSQQVSIEHHISTPGKATLLFGDKKASQELKEDIVMYIKIRLEEMETKFMDKMNTVETSLTELQDENEVLGEELQALKNRLSVTETNQNKFEGRLTAVEEKVILNDRHIEEMIIAIDKKADRSDVTQGMSKKDMSMLEDRMLKINETALLDIEELRSFLKGYTVKLREELDEKVFGFEMDCRLEPLAGRLKRLEKNLKDVSLKAQVLECQTMGPIEVKRYLHCEDGKRIKPLRKPISNWTSAAQSEMSIHHDRFFDDGETAEKIEADVRKRMEDAVFRNSKHLIGGAYTKTKVARSK